MDSNKPEESTSLDSADEPKVSSTTDSSADSTVDSTAPATPGTPTPEKPAKKPNKIKQILKKLNVYLLLFVLIVVIAAIVMVVSYLNSSKAPKTPDTASQTLSQGALKQLANSDATVGDTGQTLTVQGNAVFSGQVLVRSSLNVAGSITLGGDMTVQNLTATGTSNLANTQIQGLQVSNPSTFKGAITDQSDLNVAGATSLSGPTVVGQLTASKIILTGNALLQIPNHVAFDGPPPVRTSLGDSAVGIGGSASVDGSDTTGTININTGASTQPGCFLTLNFHTPFSSAPNVIISPIGGAAAAGQTDYYVTRTATGMSVCTANAAPQHQVFAYSYFITS